MKIGLYGDSFGTGPRSTITEIKESMKYHWITLLQNDMGAELTNYSIGGSSLYYSYRNFIQTHEEYDMVIFLVTEPGRYVKVVDLLDLPNTHIASLPHVEWFINNKQHDPLDREILNDITGWFKASCDDYIRDMSDLILNDIVSARPDVILIPCFHNSFGSKFANITSLSDNQCLAEIQSNQLAMLGIDVFQIGNKIEENPKFISGHLCPEMNKLVYSLVKHRINEGKWNWEIPKTLTLDKKSTDYYLPII